MRHVTDARAPTVKNSPLPLPTSRRPCPMVELRSPAANVSWVIFCSGRLLGCLDIQNEYKQLGMERTTTSSLVLFHRFQLGRKTLRHALAYPFRTNTTMATWVCTFWGSYRQGYIRMSFLGICHNDCHSVLSADNVQCVIRNQFTANDYIR